MQEDWQDDLGQIDERIAALIGHAALSGAYRAVMRQVPETTAGFTKLADKHSARVAALADAIAASARRIGDALEGR